MNARFAGLAWTLAALLAADAEATPTPPLRLAEPDSGRVITLPVGAEVRVDLYANPSTGAGWQRRDAFAAVLASVPCEGVVREPLVKPGETPPVGAGITVSYCFRAQAPGRAYLYLFYGRSWAADAPAWGSFGLDLTVTPAG